MYEVEPCYSRYKAPGQVTGYVADLLAAAGRGDLEGEYFGTAFDWNGTLFQVGRRQGWPGKFQTTIPGFPGVNLVADYVGAGVVMYWLEPNASALFGALPFLVPNKRLVKPHNWVPGLQPVPQPAYAVSSQEVCGYGLIGLGAVIIVGTVAETILTGGAGVWNDAVTVPAGIYFINYGQRLAVFVPASGP